MHSIDATSVFVHFKLVLSIGMESTVHKDAGHTVKAAINQMEFVSLVVMQDGKGSFVRKVNKPDSSSFVPVSSVYMSICSCNFDQDVLNSYRKGVHLLREKNMHLVFSF